MTSQSARGCFSARGTSSEGPYEFKDETLQIESAIFTEKKTDNL